MIPGSILNKLAKTRSVLAYERTFLAYIRTAIMLAVSGITMIKFFPNELHFLIIGYILPPFSLVIVGFGYVRFRKMCKNITKTTEPQNDF